jgi:lantibiotic modifying enzyme
MAWRRLLGDGEAERPLQRIDSYLKRLEAEPPAFAGDASYGSGLTGLALLYAQLTLLTGASSWREKSRTALAEALDAQARGADSRLGFFAGLTGLGWAVHRLAPCLELGDTAAITADLDEAVAAALGAGPWRWELDLVSGLAGIGCYLLDHPDRQFARLQIGVLMDRLIEAASPVAGGVCWLTRPAFLAPDQARAYPDGRFDLGVAHGAGGLIGLLARIAHAGLAGGRERTLLRQAVSWLLRNRRPDLTGSTFSRFGRPAALLSCRSAWCYGDPGLAAVLVSAAQARKDSALWQQATTLALRSAARPVEEAEVSDASLCHGSAGLGHVFNWLSQVTDEEQLRRAARFWFERTVEYFDPDRPEREGLLQGRLGTCLALLAAVSDEEPLWSRPMLLGW